MTKNYNNFKNKNQAFALPTVLISSIVMLAVLMMSVVSAAAVRASLNDQYYNQLAKNASEAGIVYARACLASNLNVPAWSDTTPLKPNTNCQGGALVPAVTDVLLNDTDNKIQTTFSVKKPTVDSSGNILSINTDGAANLLRTTGGTVWRNYNQNVLAAFISQAPDVPTGLSATGGIGQVPLSWVAPYNGGSAIIGYKIYRDLTANPTNLIQTLGNVTTYIDNTGLSPGTTYYYRVVAVNNIGDSLYSAQSVATTANPVNQTFSNTSTGSTGTIQEWTVPADGIYTIEAFGAQGGTGASYTGGLGARMRGDFSLTAGTKLKILVGQMGGNNASYKAGGGGGGTFVTKNDNSILVIAGGGGGGGGNSNPQNGQSGLTTTTGGTGSKGVYAGGTSGSYGLSGTGSNGGAGYTSNSVFTSSYTTIAYSFLNGGTGGGGGTCSAGGGSGGFGGGSGGEWCNQGAAGAGGGYSGGGGTDSNGVSGGGGSLNNGTNQSNTAGVRSGHGSVTIHN